MATRSYVSAPRYTIAPHFSSRMSVPNLMTWVKPLSLWGAATGITLFFFVDSIPVFRKGFYSKLPFIGNTYDDSVDPEDTPF